VLQWLGLQPDHFPDNPLAAVNGMQGSIVVAGAVVLVLLNRLVATIGNAVAMNHQGAAMNHQGVAMSDYTFAMNGWL
jgi:hypothetical protein